MDIWLKRRLGYIDEHMTEVLKPYRLERFYDIGKPFYRHSNNYYTHSLFFVLVFVRNHKEFEQFLTYDREMSILGYVQNKYRDKIKELIKQYE
jgi:hypothetical protein